MRRTIVFAVVLLGTLVVAVPADAWWLHRPLLPGHRHASYPLAVPLAVPFAAPLTLGIPVPGLGTVTVGADGSLLERLRERNQPQPPAPAPRITVDADVNATLQRIDSNVQNATRKLNALTDRINADLKLPDNQRFERIDVGVSGGSSGESHGGAVGRKDGTLRGRFGTDSPLVDTDKK